MLALEHQRACADAVLLASIEALLITSGLFDRFQLVERVNPEALPPEVVFLERARAERDLRATLRESVL